MKVDPRPAVIALPNSYQSPCVEPSVLNIFGLMYTVCPATSLGNDIGPAIPLIPSKLVPP